MRLILLVTAIFFKSNLFAQAEELHIKQTINTFFEGMEKNDTAKIKTTIDTSGCFLKSIMKMNDGRVVLISDDINDFFAQVIQASHLKVKEELLSFDIKIDGAMAVAWTPYKFYVNDKFVHCGVNVFTLIKREDSWKIIGITDTRRKQGCEL